jgi:undecaprenyl pyrophosphate synthase
MTNPKVIAIIPDGNRRYAKKHSKPIIWGHQQGAKTMEEFIEFWGKHGAKTIILYGLSADNLKRPKEQVEDLYRLYEERLEKWRKDAIKKKVRLQVVSIDQSVFPKSLRQVIKELTNTTKDFTKYSIKILLNWSAHSELIKVFQRIIIYGSLLGITAGAGIYLLTNHNLLGALIGAFSTLALFGFLSAKYFLKKFFLLSDEPDLIIRTSEERISDFLSIQMKYSELIFIPKLFPECTNKDWKKCLDEYNRRKRRYGK